MAPERRPPRSRAPKRRTGTGVITAVAVLLVLVAGAVVVGRALDRPAPFDTACTVTAGANAYTLDVDQTANAATIAAVARRAGLPDHAVTIALATALQESNLHNLPYGDRDSLGLFQQRPSQGWGTPAQLQNPRYAAGSFYRELVRIPNWRTIPVTEAAQHVQRSGAPTAYAQWEAEARDLAIALTGEVPAGVACRYHEARTQAAPASYEPALRDDLGVVSLTHLTRGQGWTTVAWLVSHGKQYRVQSVEYGGREWTAKSGRWQTVKTTDAAVHVEMLPPNRSI